MVNYDERNLIARLATLRPLARAAFALACAERLRPYHELEEFSGADELVTLALTRSFDAIRGDSDASLELRSIQTQLEVAPFLDDDFAAAAAYALRAFFSGDPQDAALAARRGYEARDRSASDLLEIDFSIPGAAQRVLSHPLVQRELVRQREDLDKLGERDDSISAAINHVVEKARTAARIGDI